MRDLGIHLQSPKIFLDAAASTSSIESKEQAMDLKIHLGCGKRYLPGYMHIDYSRYPHIDHVHTVTELPMIENDSASIIYASHVLEYFDDNEAMRVLKEWHSKLKLGGILRLAVPDFDKLCDVYKEKRDLKLISGPIFGFWKTEGADVLGDRWLHHRCLYDMGKLSNRLFNAGFQAVRIWDWREVFVGELAGFDDYSQAYIPHMDKENGILISLNVEATR